jgi:hypothetical protein
MYIVSPPSCFQRSRRGEGQFKDEQRVAPVRGSSQPGTHDGYDVQAAQAKCS